VVAVALKSSSLFVEKPLLFLAFLRKPEEVRESPPILRGLATEPFGAFYLKNSLEAALALEAAR